MNTLNRPKSVVAAVALALGGCASEPIDLNARLPAGAQMSQARSISGSACGFQLMLIVPIMVNSREQRAWQQLRAQAGADAITSIAIRERWFYGFIGTGYCTDMTASAVPVRKLPPPLPTIPVAPAPAVAPTAAPAQAPSGESLPATPATLPATGVPAVTPSAPPAVTPVSAPVVPPATAPAAPQPAVAPATSPAAATPVAPSAPAMPAGLVAGGKAKVKDGAFLRTRAALDGDKVNDSDAGTVVTLKVVLNKGADAWWYANFEGGSGWIRADDLEAVTP